MSRRTWVKEAESSAATEVQELTAEQQPGLVKDKVLYYWVNISWVIHLVSVIKSTYNLGRSTSTAVPLSSNTTMSTSPTAPFQRSTSSQFNDPAQPLSSFNKFKAQENSWEMHFQPLSNPGGPQNMHRQRFEKRYFSDFPSSKNQDFRSQNWNRNSWPSLSESQDR